eukprot:28576-Pelagococcus_subviridis.AAC.3
MASLPSSTAAAIASNPVRPSSRRPRRRRVYRDRASTALATRTLTRSHGEGWGRGERWLGGVRFG